MDALRLLQMRPDVDLLFTNIQVPGRFTGLWLAHAVRRQWPDIKLLVTSASQKVLQELPVHGHFISKPYTPEELLSEIDTLFKQQ